MFFVTNPFVHYCTTYLLFQYIFCNKNSVNFLNQNASSLKEYKLLYSYLLIGIVIKELFVTMSLCVLSTKICTLEKVVSYSMAIHKVVSLSRYIVQMFAMELLL